MDDKQKWRHLILPVHGGRDVHMWLPIPFTERDFDFLMKFLDLMREAWFGVGSAALVPTVEGRGDA